MLLCVSAGVLIKARGTREVFKGRVRVAALMALVCAGVKGPARRDVDNGPASAKVTRRVAKPTSGAHL